MASKGFVTDDETFVDVIVRGQGGIMYTAKDARREVRECLAEGYGFDYIRIFLNDLARAKDITWAEHREIMLDLIKGRFGEVDCSYGTY